MNVEKATRFLASSITETRKSRIASVVASRTNNVAVLLENITGKGNENATLRSMDALGFQNIHLVRSPEIVKKIKTKDSRTDSGAQNWITICNWTSVSACVKHLKESGYKIAAASPDTSVSISEVDFTKKIVVAFGNEWSGVSDALLQGSDLTFSLPMCGFVRSFNVSVAVAITLYHAYMQRVLKLVSINRQYLLASFPLVFSLFQYVNSLYISLVQGMRLVRE